MLQGFSCYWNRVCCIFKTFNKDMISTRIQNNLSVINTKPEPSLLQISCYKQGCFRHCMVDCFAPASAMTKFLFHGCTGYSQSKLSCFRCCWLFWTGLFLKLCNCWIMFLQPGPRCAMPESLPPVFTYDVIKCATRQFWRFGGIFLHYRKLLAFSAPPGRKIICVCEYNDSI